MGINKEKGIDRGKMYDILISNGLVPDFEKKEFYKADVAVKDGKIEAILEAGSNVEAARTIDAEGLVVSPGFIDMHMHEEEFRDEVPQFDISELMIRMGVTTGVCGNCGMHFHRLAEFKEIVKGLGGGLINLVPLTGYNTFRDAQGLGWYEDASPEIRERIIGFLREELEEGAWGVSFGLEYDPGISTEEMTSAIMALKEYDPFVSIHFRSDCDECMDSIREMAELSENTGCNVEISHIGSLAAVGGHMTEALDYLRVKMKENPKLRYDVYPYNAFCTLIGSAAFDMDWRAKWNVDYDIIMPLAEPYLGMRCDEEMYNKLLKDDPDALVVAFALDEDDVRAAMKEPMGLFGSDGEVFPGYDVHPRAVGTFPRILGKYVREEKLLPLIDALDKMTRQAAGFTGLAKKGEIRVGMDADILIFDPDTIKDNADYLNTREPNDGISCVIVNGVPVVVNDKLTGATPGRILHRSERQY